MHRHARSIDATLSTDAAWSIDGTPHQSARRTALAGLIGNVLEWFDFAVYGYFATAIGRQFFPQSSAGAQQLLAFAVLDRKSTRLNSSH